MPARVPSFKKKKKKSYDDLRSVGGSALCFMDHVVNNAMQEVVVEEDRGGPVTIVNSARTGRKPRTPLSDFRIFDNAISWHTTHFPHTLHQRFEHSTIFLSIKSSAMKTGSMGVVV